MLMLQQDIFLGKRVGTIFLKDHVQHSTPSPFSPLPVQPPSHNSLLEVAKLARRAGLALQVMQPRDQRSYRYTCERVSFPFAQFLHPLPSHAAVCISFCTNRRPPRHGRRNCQQVMSPKLLPPTPSLPVRLLTGYVTGRMTSWQPMQWIWKRR